MIYVRYYGIEIKWSEGVASTTPILLIWRFKLDINKRILELHDNQYSYREISEIINSETNTTYWDSERIRDKIRKCKRRTNEQQIKNINVPLISKNPNIVIKNKKIMVMADLHFPFHREDILPNIKKHADEISALIIGGDAMNNDSLSRFAEISKLSFEEEIIEFYNFIQEIRNILPINVKIIFIRGNHEYRLYKYIANQHDKQLQKFINPEVIQMLVDGFTVYEGTKKFEYLPIENIEYVPHWFVNINNQLIVCHPEEFSRVQVKTVMDAIQYFMSRNEQFSMVINTHLHTYGESKKFGKYGIQLGCSCKPQRYADRGNFKYSPQDYNYMIVQFDDNGEVGINNSKVYHLEELYPITEQEINYKIQI
jgi:predicted phosphodiesterase